MDFCQQQPSSYVYLKGPVNFPAAARELYSSLANDLLRIRQATLAQEESPLAFAEGLLKGSWSALDRASSYQAAGSPKIHVCVVSVPAHSVVLSLGFMFEGDATMYVVLPDDPRQFYVYASALPNIEFNRVHSIKYVDILTGAAE